MGHAVATREGYDGVSGEYASRFRDELDPKPFDREILTGITAFYSISRKLWVRDADV